MRIRLPFAGVFTLLILISAYAGLSSIQVSPALPINDKLLHAITFFLLTVVFYWVVDTNRRRTLNLTLTVCTACLGVGSEIVQGFLPNGREFDLYDILANVVGSLAGLGLCSWYHKRMLERKRVRRYTAVPGEEGQEEEEEEDLELGEGLGVGARDEEEGHEEGVVTAAVAPAAADGGQKKSTSLEEEVDNWDENEIDAWDEEDDLGDLGVSSRSQSQGAVGVSENGVDHGKKRSD
ncbi:hypothetical protein QBC42DRAFT_276526 [Cladorrhinum samala]|uniref:VanZ-like domain-containing protein n=1 Tax=Cladorrhinum samala TaxID=585594 RepID=A0AAV9HFI2_9PEZI|nr:hypothetical protein QBC42DRAFT_276526 [Cladorrhinum samala]